MSVLMTTLICIVTLLLIAIFYFGVFFLSAFITNRKIKRRYIKENDIGRRRQEFSRSVKPAGEDPGHGMESTDERQSELQIPVDNPVNEDESESRDDGEKPNFHQYDYERFKEEFLN